MYNNLLVVAGGGIGALLRYRANIVMKSMIPDYLGAGTLIVNVIGSLLIGYWLGCSHDAKSVSETSRLFFVVGILGGLTTFSSLAHETVVLMNRQGAPLSAGLGHMTANVVLGLGAVWVGAWLGRATSTT